MIDIPINVEITDPEQIYEIEKDIESRTTPYQRELWRNTIDLKQCSDIEEINQLIQEGWLVHQYCDKFIMLGFPKTVMSAKEYYSTTKPPSQINLKKEKTMENYIQTNGKIKDIKVTPSCEDVNNLVKQGYTLQGSICPNQCKTCKDCPESNYTESSSKCKQIWNIMVLVESNYPVIKIRLD